MKKTPSSSEFISNEYLDETLKKQFSEFRLEMDKRFQETNAVMDKRFQETNDVMDKRFSESQVQLDKKFDAFQKYFDFRLEPIEESQKENEAFKARVLDSLDWLVGAFKKFDEEHTVLSGNYSDIQSKIHDHEERLHHLESRATK